MRAEFSKRFDAGCSILTPLRLDVPARVVNNGPVSWPCLQVLNAHGIMVEVFYTEQIWARPRYSADTVVLYRLVQGCPGREEKVSGRNFNFDKTLFTVYQILNFRIA